MPLNPWVCSDCGEVLEDGELCPVCMLCPICCVCEAGEEPSWDLSDAEDDRYFWER